MKRRKKDPLENDIDKVFSSNIIKSEDKAMKDHWEGSPENETEFFSNNIMKTSLPFYATVSVEKVAANFVKLKSPQLQYFVLFRIIQS